MKLIKVGVSVLNQTPLAWTHNLDNILGAIEDARAQQVTLLCLPEMCITGYGCEDAFHSSGLQETALSILREIAPATRGMVVSVGLPVMVKKGLYNAACLLVDGAIAGFVAKRFLAGDGIHYEPRWFKPWPANKRDEVEIDSVAYPIGDLYFDVGGVRIGYEICEDAWVANRPGGELALRGVDVILNPSASHFSFGKFYVRKNFVTEGSRAFGVAYLYANLLGNEAGRIIYDGGGLIASGGELIAVGSRLSFRDRELTTAVVDITANRVNQSRTASFRPMVGDAEEDCVEVEFSFPERNPAGADRSQSAWEGGDSLKEEEFSRAVALALFDYLRKSRSRGFVVSISGGADSAACACLVGLAIELATRELGRDGVLAKLGYIPGLSDASDVAGMVARLLTCVYQGTRNSSDTTRDAAQGVSDAVGARFHELDVDGLVADYVSMIGGALGRELSWDTDDLALQNIQARVRGPGVWMFANIQSALLLATSNRSEAAVGYATMDGDTCGGLSPIAGIDKAFLRQWLRWLEAGGPDGTCAVPALAAVNVQAPTAELRPQEQGQTDEGDLMPYDLLDAIECSAIRDKHTPLEVYQEMRVVFPQFEQAQLGQWVEKFFKLWCRNQWKRERYAPSFHVDDKNLDPKTWCRFPILSGGFERELADLRDHVARGTGAGAGAGAGTGERA